MTSIQLRPYQIECLESIKSLFLQNITRLLVAMATGAGKTVIIAYLIKQRKGRTLVIVQSIELLMQTLEKIKMICPELDVGLVDANHKEFEKDVVITTIQSARIPENLARLKRGEFATEIIDEAHHAASESYHIVSNELGFGKDTKKLKVGFTATPYRSDNKGLGEVYDVIAYELTIRNLIESGYLCRPIGHKVATDIDFSTIKTADGDFTTTSLAAVMDIPEMNELVVEAYKKNAHGRQSICFGVSVRHSMNLAETFRKHGINSKAVYGDMPKDERASVIEEYRSGFIQVLCNCQILTEGVDIPSTSCVVMAKPTKSRGLYTQCVGRGLRLYPNKKDCIIIDFNDANHTICNTAMLLKDTEAELVDEEENLEDKKLRLSLPSNLNKQLKSAILNFDPLGQDFCWFKEGPSYVMKGSGKIRLEVSPHGTDRYHVLLSDEKGFQLIAENLNFEYAFATAEGYAKDHRKLFTVSDQTAAWRLQPISEKQRSFIRSKGYRAGLDDLTKGQASQIIETLVRAK